MRRFRFRRPATVAAMALLLAPSAQDARSQLESAAPYFPPRGEWEHRSPEEVGMDASHLEQAITFAYDNESTASVDLAEYIRSTLANEPHGEIVGPTRARGAINGLVVKDGFIVAEWGPTRRVDMTFSVTKTYLSTVVGLAWDADLIRDVHDPVRATVPTEHFDAEHNAKVTWDHLLRQTSDWRGTLWDKPDWADRPPRGLSLEELPNQPPNEPGSSWKYNDVRVNLLALAALHVWREPLPRILRERVMDPIGASRTWSWNGYENSWVTIDGVRVQSVSGGGHWGGGMFVSTRDHARFGYLFLRMGLWGERRIVSEEWIEMARTPTGPNRSYGFMNWFLNAPRREGGQRLPMPSAPRSSVTFRGAGSNVIYVDWENDLVVVVRWIQGRALDGFVGHVLAAIEAG